MGGASQWAGGLKRARQIRACVWAGLKEEVVSCAARRRSVVKRCCQVAKLK